MAESGTTLSQIENCLARLKSKDPSAWDDLFRYAFDRLLAQCARIVRRQLSRPHPLITENSVLAASYQRLCTAMKNDQVSPTTAREFFGLTARNIGWQILDMLQKRSEQQGNADLFAQIPEGDAPEEEAQADEKWELFWTAVNSFEEQEREVFDLIWVNELSQYETAETMGLTRNQVDTIWRRVKIAIVKACKDYAILDS